MKLIDSKLVPMVLALGAGCQTTPASTPSGAEGAQSAPTQAQEVRSSMKIAENGTGRNVLVLHGGGGPGTMMGLVAHLARKAHVITPTFPGWDGTPRPASLSSVPALADEVVRLLDERDLKDVVVIGSSLGGWVGAEVALRDKAHRIAGLVIIDGTGVDIPGQPITNVTGFTPQQLAKVAYHDPSKMGAGAPPPTPERIAMIKANQATMTVFAGDTHYCYDPTLLGRLRGIQVPTLLLWGASDHVVTQEYGRAYAGAIPNAKFETVAAAGHLPWLEQPEETFGAVDRFLAATPDRP